MSNIITSAVETLTLGTNAVEFVSVPGKTFITAQSIAALTSTAVETVQNQEHATEHGIPVYALVATLKALTTEDNKAIVDSTIEAWSSVDNSIFSRQQFQATLAASRALRRHASDKMQARKHLTAEDVK